jgi:hypothetical protein
VSTRKRGRRKGLRRKGRGEAGRGAENNKRGMGGIARNAAKEGRQEGIKVVMKEGRRGEGG